MDDVRTLLTCDEKVSCTLSAAAWRKKSCAKRQQEEPTVGRKGTLCGFESTIFIAAGSPVPTRPAPVPLGDEDSDGRQEPSRRRHFLAERAGFLAKRSPIWAILARFGAYWVLGGRAGAPGGWDRSMLVPDV